MKIKAILRIVIPRTFTGETAFMYTDTATGNYVEGFIRASEGNVRGAVRILNNGEWEGREDARTYVTVEEIPNRKFKSMIKDLSYVGSQPEEVAAYITDGLNSPDVASFGE